MLADVSHSIMIYRVTLLLRPILLLLVLLLAVSQYFIQHRMNQPSIDPQFLNNDGSSAPRQRVKGKAKAKELRRDPEKKRKQNQKAQRKYSEQFWFLAALSAGY